MISSIFKIFIQQNKSKNIILSSSPSQYCCYRLHMYVHPVMPSSQTACSPAISFPNKIKFTANYIIINVYVHTYVCLYVFDKPHILS